MARRKRRPSYIIDPMLDDVDHALGRPDDPLGRTYRNYYALEADCDLAGKLRASPFWKEGNRAPGSDMTVFHVTDAGRRALDAHLKAPTA